MHEIVGLIRLDAGIAARVLLVANSAYFSKGSRCLTVEEAVHRVGYDQVFELVSFAVASQVLVRPLEVYGLDADELWRMSVAGALAAEVLAERLALERDVAYTVGLLHCVGMVAVDEWALRNARSLRLARGPFPVEASAEERTKLGFTQAEAGGALLRLWGFPVSIVEPVRWQYLPRGSVGHARMATLLSTAKWLRNLVCHQPAEAPAPAALKLLGLEQEALEILATEVEQRLQEVDSILSTGESAAVDRRAFPARAWNS
jgi:HD-like signal output (HDOD) protein